MRKNLIIFMSGSFFILCTDATYLQKTCNNNIVSKMQIDAISKITAIVNDIKNMDYLTARFMAAEYFDEYFFPESDNLELSEELEDMFMHLVLYNAGFHQASTPEKKERLKKELSDLHHLLRDEGMSLKQTKDEVLVNTLLKYGERSLQ